MLGLLHKFSLHAHDPSVGYLAIKTNEYERVMKARVSTINKFIIPGWGWGGVRVRQHTAPRSYSSAASSVSHQTHRWRRMGSPPPIHRSQLRRRLHPPTQQEDWGSLSGGWGEAELLVAGEQLPGATGRHAAGGCGGCGRVHAGGGGGRES